LRVGDIVINPGKLPALISDTRASVSFSPLMNTKPPPVDVDETPCAASTRVVNLLGGVFVEDEEPQDRKLRLISNTTVATKTALFKRDAPNNMKTEI
jgi:hypothetical protein